MRSKGLVKGRKHDRQVLKSRGRDRKEVERGMCWKREREGRRGRRAVHQGWSCLATVWGWGRTCLWSEGWAFFDPGKQPSAKCWRHICSRTLLCSGTWFMWWSLTSFLNHWSFFFRNFPLKYNAAKMSWDTWLVFWWAETITSTKREFLTIWCAQYEFTGSWQCFTDAIATSLHYWLQDLEDNSSPKHFEVD
jgi:hypothetical protein